MASWLPNWLLDSGAAGVRGFPPPQPLTPEGLLEKAAELGIRLVQFADNLPLDNLADDELDAVLERATKHGIALELGMRGIGAKDVQRHLRAATRLGARLLRIVVDTNLHHPPADEIVAALRDFIPECDRLGITLAIENHDRFQAATMRGIAIRTSSSNCGRHPKPRWPPPWVSQSVRYLRQFISD